VFTNPKVQLDIRGCSLEVTRLDKLRGLLRRMAGKGRDVTLTSARVRQLQAIFDRRMETAGSWR
jgi:hypothetical protein